MIRTQIGLRVHGAGHRTLDGRLGEATLAHLLGLRLPVLAEHLHEATRAEWH